MNDSILKKLFKGSSKVCIYISDHDDIKNSSVCSPWWRTHWKWVFKEPLRSERSFVLHRTVYAESVLQITSTVSCHPLKNSRHMSENCAHQRCLFWKQCPIIQQCVFVFVSFSWSDHTPLPSIQPALAYILMLISHPQTSSDSCHRSEKHATLRWNSHNFPQDIITMEMNSPADTGRQVHFLKHVIIHRGHFMCFTERAYKSKQ